MKLKTVSAFAGALFCTVPAVAQPELKEHAARERYCLELSLRDIQIPFVVLFIRVLLINGGKEFITK